MIGAWNRGGWWRAIAAANGLAVAATFAFFYPVYTAMPITADALDLRLWLGGWH